MKDLILCSTAPSVHQQNHRGSIHFSVLQQVLFFLHHGTFLFACRQPRLQNAILGVRRKLQEASRDTIGTFVLCC